MEPSTSRSVPSRNPRGKVVRSQAKRMIINIYHEKLEANPNATYKEIRAMVSKTSGIGVGTISAVLSEYKRTGKLSSPTITRTKLGICDKLSEEQKSKIRQHVYDFWRRQEVPTVKNMLEMANTDPDLPTFSASSFRRVLQHLNFGYAKNCRNSGLIEHIKTEPVIRPNTPIIFDHTYTSAINTQVHSYSSSCTQKQNKSKKRVNK